MSYATNIDVQQRMSSAVYIQLTDDVDSGTADEAKVTEARMAAECDVDSYLGQRYQVPVDVAIFTELHPLLRSVTLDLTEYRLHSRRPAVPANVVAKRAAAIDWLGKVASGVVVLPSVSELPSRASEGLLTEVSGTPRMWSNDETENL